MNKIPRFSFLKYINVGVLAVLFIVVGSYAWFSSGRIPNAVDLEINDATAMLKVEIYNAESGTYDILHEESVSDLSPGVLAIDVPEMIFYRWEDSVISSVTENLFYRITVTSRFDPVHFSTDPLFYMTPDFNVEATKESFAAIDIIKVEYLITDPLTDSQDPELFPSSGFEMMDLDRGLNETILSDKTGVVKVNADDRFQTIVYIMVSSDTDAVAEIIDDLMNASLNEPHTATNKLKFSFGFRSTPFYTPEPPQESEEPSESTGE